MDICFQIKQCNTDFSLSFSVSFSPSSLSLSFFFLPLSLSLSPTHHYIVGLSVAFWCGSAALSDPGISQANLQQSVNTEQQQDQPVLYTQWSYTLPPPDSAVVTQVSTTSRSASSQPTHTHRHRHRHTDTQTNWHHLFSLSVLSLPPVHIHNMPLSAVRGLLHISHASGISMNFSVGFQLFVLVPCWLNRNMSLASDKKLEYIKYVCFCGGTPLMAICKHRLGGLKS